MSKKADVRRIGSPGPPALEALRGRLQEKRKKFRSYTELARAARVSNSTLHQVLKGLSEEAEERIKRPGRHQRAFVASLARICAFADREGLDPRRIAVEAYGIVWSDDLIGVAGAAREELLAPSDPDDIVIRTILERGRAIIPGDGSVAAKGRVRAGLLVWEPFHSANSTRSFAYTFTRALVQAVALDWWIETVEIASTSDAADMLRTGELDLCWGLFPAPARYLRGIDFIAVDGFRIQLEAISNNEELTWERIAEKSLAGKKIHAFALEDELGHLWLQGVCGFRTTGIAPDLTVIGTQKGAAYVIAASVANCDPSKIPVFISDPVTCSSVLKDGTLSGFKEMLDGEADVGPTYPVALAIRSDALIWKGLLEAAKEQDVYPNWPPLARLICEVLESPHAEGYEWNWEAVPLHLRPRLARAATAHPRFKEIRDKAEKAEKAEKAGKEDSQMTETEQRLSQFLHKATGHFQK